MPVPVLGADILKSKKNPFADLSRDISDVDSLDPVLRHSDNLAAGKQAHIDRFSAKPKRKHVEIELENNQGQEPRSDESSVPPAKQPKLRRKARGTRGESEMPASAAPAPSTLIRTDSRGRAASSPPTLHRDPQRVAGFLIPSESLPPPRKNFIDPRLIPSTSGSSRSEHIVSPSVFPILDFKNLSSSTTTHAFQKLSKKRAADMSVYAQDQLKQFIERIETLEAKQKIQDKALTLMARLHEDVDTLKSQEADLRVLVNKLSAGHALSPVETKAVTDAANNTIKDMIRRVIIGMMGIENADYLPDNPDPDVKGKDRFWVTGVADEKLLRPDFATSWGKNALWHKDLWKEIEKRGPKLVPACTEGMIAGMGKAEMLRLAGRTTFKHLKERYIKERKSQTDLDREKKDKVISARKAKKAKERLDVRNDFAALTPQTFTWIFHKEMQSSDNTSSDNTDYASDEPGRSGSSRGDNLSILKTGEPNYRSDLLCDIYDKLDATVKLRKKIKLAALKKQGKASKKAPVVVKRGYVSVKTCLPNNVKIHRWGVDPEWLQLHGGENEQFADDEDEDDAVCTPVWELSNSKGKQKAKEVHQAKPHTVIKTASQLSESSSGSSDSTETSDYE